MSRTAQKDAIGKTRGSKKRELGKIYKKSMFEAPFLLANGIRADIMKIRYRRDGRHSRCLSRMGQRKSPVYSNLSICRQERRNMGFWGKLFGIGVAAAGAAAAVKVAQKYSENKAAEEEARACAQPDEPQPEAQPQPTLQDVKEDLVEAAEDAAYEVKEQAAGAVDTAKNKVKEAAGRAGIDTDELAGSLSEAGKAIVVAGKAVVNAGVTFEFRYETPEGKQEKDFFYEKGIEDYVEELADGDSLTPVRFCQSSAEGRDREDKPDYKVKMNAAFCFSNKGKLLEYYHNSSWLEHGGSPDKAVKAAFVAQIDAFLHQKNMYKKGESKIKFEDVQDCLIFVSSSFSTQTSYENQTKKSITNRFIQQAMTEFLRHNLEVYFLEKPDEAQKIAQQVLINKQSREHADKTRLGLKNTLTKQLDIANRVQKFVDCRSKDLAKRELYIVEGDSAMGAVKTSRDSEYQAIMPVRGKILNCLKADYARIFKSDVITDLIKVLGCGVELSGKAKKDLSSFDLANLRWNKIIICTDADVDGYQIRTLILTMIYRLVPTLIKEGYVYIAESPLYEINSKGKTYFAYTEPEKAEFLARIGNAKYTIQRSKGLGENDAEMMWLTTMNPASRRLIRVTPTDAEATAAMFDLLLGDNLAGRKEHIAQHGHEYLDELDVS